MADPPPESSKPKPVIPADWDPSEPACDPSEWNANRGILVNEEWDRENLPPLDEVASPEERS